MGRISQEAEKFRVTTGMWATHPGDQWGMFMVKVMPGKPPLAVIVAPFDGSQLWEHVSVSLPNRCPTWGEMSFIKDLFWDEEESVVQFHPPKSQYVNNHPYCLHLWRNTQTGHPTPPVDLVGLKT